MDELMPMQTIRAEHLQPYFSAQWSMNGAVRSCGSVLMEGFVLQKQFTFSLIFKVTDINHLEFPKKSHVAMPNYPPTFCACN